MCKIILKFSTNNIFLTFLLNNKSIYSKSSGQFAIYNKGKQKISNIAVIHLLNNFLNFYLLNCKKIIFFILDIEIYGCTLKRFFFLKRNLKFFFLKFKTKKIFIIDKSLFAFNGCKLKKKKRKKKKRKKVKIK